jgi:4-coumarate--CoA ligase
VKIVDEKGEMLGIGEKGEIIANGLQIVIGFYRNERATEEAFDKEEFLRTGDEGCEG